MKSTFTRTFVTVTVILLVGLLCIGVFLRALLRGYLDETTYAQLETDAKVLSGLAANYNRLSDLDFGVNLHTVSAVSDADTVICDVNGRIVLCSDSSVNRSCRHVGMKLTGNYLERVAANSGTRDMGLIKGLYEDSRYVCATAVRSNGAVVGYVIVSIPVATSQAVLQKMTDFYVILAVLVVLLSVLAVSIFVHRQSKPLRLMAKTARRFGQGELSARAPLKDSYTYEVSELATAFNNMATSLEKSEQQRQEFVANVSHELKTPMTTIGGYVDGVLDGTIPEEKADQYLQVVSAETKRLSRLVRSMLDISRLQDAAIPEEQRTRFDLSETVGRTLLNFEQKINDKQLQVEVTMPDYPLYTNGNMDYITQVVYNLLDNAVKFCPPEGVLGVSLREVKSKIYVAVYNDGETIPEEELPMVFDRFHKIDKSRSENRDSWGLGLHIAKTIVCSHGENISVTSLAGRTEFTFTMPLVAGGRQNAPDL